MNLTTWTQVAKRLTERAGFQDQILTTENFLDYANRLRDVVLALPKKEHEKPWCKDFSFHLRKLRDDFDTIITADPMCVYKPKHSVAAAFHKSKARVRYYFGANRTSKTMSSIAEVYWTLTDQHPYRPRPPQPATIATIGYDYRRYVPNVFQPKYISGEQGNPLSPVFPERGKWLYSYDPRAHIIDIACGECAEAGKAQSCPHPKRRITLFSDEAKPDSLEGGQFAGIHIDEQVQREYYSIGRERIKTVPNGWMCISETPKRGKGFWTQKELVPLADSKMCIPETDILICETFQIDQFQAGLVPHNEIIASMEGKPQSEIRVKIFGEPMVSLEQAIFDPDVLSHMRSTEVRDGDIGQFSIELEVEGEQFLSHEYPEKSQRQILIEASEETRCQFLEGPGDVEIYEYPQAYTQYIIGADVAHGLTSRDASAADVLKMYPQGDSIILEQVAQFHGWINPMLYAEELFKLGLFYSVPHEHYPYLVVERNGPGLECIQCLIDMNCWFVFQDVTSGAQVKFQMQAQYGVTTSFASKPVLVSVLQSLIRNRKYGRVTIIVRSARTIDQMESFIQEETDKGNVRFLAEEGNRDDCVISLAVGAYGAKNFPIYDWELASIWRERARREQEEAMKTSDPRSRDFWKAIHEEREEEEQRQYDLALEMGIDPEQLGDDGW